MPRSLVLLALSGAAAVAKQTTADILLPGWDPEAGLSASVMGAGSDLTTVAMACPYTRTCAQSQRTTITQGESTWSVASSFNNAHEHYTMDIACDLDRREDKMACTMAVEQGDDETTSTSTRVDTTSGFTKWILPVTVTAGAGKLDAAPGATKTEGPGPTGSPSGGAGPAGTTTSGAESTGTKNGAPKPASSSTEGSEGGGKEGQGSQTTPSSTDNGASPKATQNAMVAGAVAVVGGAMVL